MTKLGYAMKFVSDMDAAVKFHRDVLGFPLKFQSPQWSELATGETTLALHLANAEHPAGTVRLGLSVPDLAAFHARLTALGIMFTRPPTLQHGTLLAEFLDADGAEISVSEARKAG